MKRPASTKPANIKQARTNVGEAAGRLRERVLGVADGAFLGSEDLLERELGVSKPTIRQAARVLEREGLLVVRRGNAGGYYGARPDAAFIEATMASYLEVIHTRPQDLTRVATALWVETVRQAAALPREQTAALAARLRRRVARVPAEAGFSEVQVLEREIRGAIFGLVESPYVELIFNINASFAHRKFAASPWPDFSAERHRALVEEWREAMLLLLDALARGDGEVAVIAARRARALVHERIWPGDETAPD